MRIPLTNERGPHQARTRERSSGRLSPAALGPDAGEWLQHATLAIRARITIQPCPRFSEIYLVALEALHSEIVTTYRVAGAAP